MTFNYVVFSAHVSQCCDKASFRVGLPLILGALAGQIIMSMIVAKFFITISFDGVYLYSVELFPTAIR